MTRRFDDPCHKLAEYSIGAAEETVNLGQGWRMGTRKGTTPCAFRFDKCCEAAARAVESNGNFVFYGGDNFSGDNGATDYSTDI
jgi:hypothetical protein